MKDRKKSRRRSVFRNILFYSACFLSLAAVISVIAYFAVLITHI